MATAQVETQKSQYVSDVPDFHVDALSFSSDDSTVSRVDVYIRISYDALQFVKRTDDFLARYEVTVNFLTPEDVLQSEKVWTEEIKTREFELTQSRTAVNLSQRSLTLSPGIYTVRTQIRDLESKKVSTVIRKMIVDNYVSSRLSVSDIMLVSRVTSDGDRKSIMPNVSGNITESNNRFYAFFEIYDAAANDSVRIRYRIADSKGKEFHTSEQSQPLHGHKGQFITQFDSLDYPTGSYVMTIEVHSFKGDETVTPVSKQKMFVVRWGNIPVNVSDLDLAIKQARYIAKDNEYSLFEEAATDEQKRKLFDAFWKKRDPNPATKRNEVMEEYYNRVEYANKHFSHYIPGWRTDMGMVFIIFGSPNNVERHPFDIDAKPYEIWSYYDYNRNVVFVDETGFGDYRLLTPIWDLIQRLKY